MADQDSAEQLKRKVDFEKRRALAIQEMDAVLTKHAVGFNLGLGGLPNLLKPVIMYSDMFQWDKPEEIAPKSVKKDGKKKATKKVK